MTTETRKRIRAYKKMLPELRERVIAVALLLAMSASMLGSASFAWITLSRSPEVSGMSTTVAANGNLEIALADGLTKDPIVAPDESAVGDSTAAQGIVNSNVTWGNLVNLSDPIYGISNIALRPASLSNSGRNVAPLYGANYGEDGRVKNTLAEYQYASWKYDKNGKGYFDARDINYGVRAITSIKYDNVSTNAALKSFWDNIDGEKGKYPLAKTGYLELIQGKTMVGSNTTGLQALTMMIQLYAQDQVDEYLASKSLGSGKKDDYKSCITYFYRLMEKFLEILEYEGEALRQIANLQVFLKDSSKGDEFFKTLDDLLNASNLSELGVNLKSLNTFRTDYREIKKYVDPDSPDSIAQLAAEYAPDDPDISPKTEPVRWATIQPAVYSLVDIDKTTLDNIKITALASAGFSKLWDMVSDTSKTHSVVIGGGILKEAEQRLGVRTGDNNVVITITVDASLLGKKSIKAKVSTTAAPDAYGYFISDQDIDTSEKMQGGSVIQGTDPVSKDTYGMAIDLWVRTNAENSVLTLEGHKVYSEEPVMVKDNEDNDQLLYTIISGEYEIEAYQKGGTGPWYYASSHEEIGSDVTIDDKIPVVENIIIGFEGENRVWGNDSLVWDDMIHDGHIAQDRTTQGAGSCFVFYANPSDQNNIMDMLKAFRIFFMDQNGGELGRAYLNTEDAYAINGKVTVPIEMLNGTEYTLLDEFNLPQIYTGITGLPQNEPQRITAIIYLDGSIVDNQNVLAAGEIEGQLNLQFGSSVELGSINDSELQQKYRSVTATASYGSEISTNESSAIDGPNGEGLTYDGNPKTVHVTLTVDGDQPNAISGFFVRSINATQGTQEETKNFTKNENGTWSADFNLTKPGKYILRSVIVDGVEYPLMRVETDVNTGLESTVPAYPTVLITGLNVSGIFVSNDRGPIASGEYLTADDRWPVSVEAQIDAEASLMPSNVRAVFMGTNGQEFNAIMSYNQDTNKWSGSTAITRSGTYTLKYMVLDTEYVEVSGPTYTVKLGMRARVWADPAEATKTAVVDGETVTVNAGLTSTEFEFMNEEIVMPVSVEIWNDANEEMEDLNGTLNLYYHDSTGVDAYGLHTELTWTGDRYEGSFLLDEPGRFSFNRVDIDLVGSTETSEVRKAEFAPKIAPVSPYSPVYSNEYDMTEDLQLTAMTGKSATIKVAIPYASQDVAAKLVDQNSGNDYGVVKGQATSERVSVTVENRTVHANVYEFTIPNSKTYPGAPDGRWKIQNLYFWGVYKDGQYIEALPESGEMDLSKSYSISVPDAVTTKVVATLIPELKKTDDTIYKGQALGGTKTEDAAKTFMEAQTIDTVNVQIKDWEGLLVPGIAQLKWDVKYEPNVGTVNGAAVDTISTLYYGGYTADYLGKGDAGRIVATIPLTKSGDTFTTSADAALSLAGKFTSSFQVAFEEGDTAQWHVAIPKDNVEYTVASKKPTVTITDITLDDIGPYSVDTNPNTATVDTSSYTDRQTSIGRFYRYFERTYTCRTAAAHLTRSEAEAAGYTSRIEDEGRTAWLYFKCSHEDIEEYTSVKSGQTGRLTEITIVDDPDWKLHNYVYSKGTGIPRATITLSNAGAATNAKLVFAESDKKTVQLFTQYQEDNAGRENTTAWANSSYQTDSYEWNMENSVLQTACTRFVGAMDNGNGTNKNDTKTAAGTLQATRLVLTYEGMGYDVPVTITIHNPF